MNRSHKIIYFWSSALIVALAVVILALRFDATNRDQAYVAQFVGKNVEVSGTVFDDPDTAVDGLTKLRLNNLYFGNDRNVKANLYVTISGSEDVRRSDQVTISGKLSGNFGSFAGSIYRGSVIKIERPVPGDLALEARDAFGNLIKEKIEEPKSSLALGYLLGARRALPSDIVEVLKIVGLTHIVVASGYNLTILVRFTRRIFGKVSHFASFFFALVLVFGFIAITGASPSMVRAGIVSVLSLTAWYLGRNFHPVRLLFITAVATLLLNPTYINDLGWQLSFAAFAGVMIFSPVITKYFYGDKKPNFLAQVLLETLSATLLTLPILLFNFGFFSLVALPANILILPTIPLVMATVFLTGGFSFLAILSQFFAFISSIILQYHLAVMDFFGRQTWAIVEANIGLIGMTTLYVGIFAIWFYMKKVSRAQLLTVNIVKWDYEKDD
ncbi:MAG: ComEC/Rec2 family competence protein [Candidatus Nomurabacteria bacterium]|jgi:competence protein ComEC|nr:ComEC/Rec2 family competence protein [Candidatus Nomurabacteria bacterium]